MKAAKRHLGQIRKQVIRSTRRINEGSSTEVDLNRSGTLPETLDDRDAKRKMPRDFVRHTAQRERMH